jgi:hypothetical protein
VSRVREQKPSIFGSGREARHDRTAVVFTWSRTFLVVALPGHKDHLRCDVAAISKKEKRQSKE